MIDKLFWEVGKFFAKHADFIFGVIVNLVLIYLVCKLVDTFQNKIEQKLRVKNPKSPLLNLMPILTKIIKIIVIFLLLAGFLQSFGYNVTSLIAGFGITGLAVGFAAKETLGNVFGSVGLLADKVYKIGEYVKFDSTEGTVENINLRSTTLRTLDGFLVNVPNNVIANEAITNMSLIDRRKIDISVDIEYGTSNEKIDEALEILKDIAENSPNILKNYTVFIDNMAPSSIVLRLFSYTSTTSYFDYLKEKGEVYRQIIRRFRDANVNFAFPSLSVYNA